MMTSQTGDLETHHRQPAGYTISTPFLLYLQLILKDTTQLFPLKYNAGYKMTLSKYHTLMYNKSVNNRLNK